MRARRGERRPPFPPVIPDRVPAQPERDPGSCRSRRVCLQDPMSAPHHFALRRARDPPRCGPRSSPLGVIPAKAGTQTRFELHNVSSAVSRGASSNLRISWREVTWVPASAGMTVWVWDIFTSPMGRGREPGVSQASG